MACLCHSSRLVYLLLKMNQPESCHHILVISTLHWGHYDEHINKPGDIMILVSWQDSCWIELVA